MVMLLLPGLAVISAPAVQLPPKPLGLATTKPAGDVSLMATPTSAVAIFGLEKVKVSEVVAFSGTLAAPKAFTAVGARTTSSDAVLLGAPTPLSLAETGPVVLFSTPVPGTSKFMVTTQNPAALTFRTE